MRYHGRVKTADALNMIMIVIMIVIEIVITIMNMIMIMNMDMNMNSIMIMIMIMIMSKGGNAPHSWFGARRAPYRSSAPPVSVLNFDMHPE